MQQGRCLLKPGENRSTIMRYPACNQETLAIGVFHGIEHRTC